jgi:hypothetical protein
VFDPDFPFDCRVFVSRRGAVIFDSPLLTLFVLSCLSLLYCRVFRRSFPFSFEVFFS